jgi:mono/diheme cytochrome c family protein
MIQHRARTYLVTAAAIFAAAAGYNLTGAAVQAQAPAPTPKIWTGIYSPEQVTRGKAAYDAYCSRCHQPDLTGGAGAAAGGGRGRGRAGGPPALKDDRFWLDFDGQSLSSLMSKIQRTMPQDAPGSLREDDYLDLLSYILSQNTFPAGKSDLAVAGLDSYLVVGRSGAAREAASFSLVRAVGCLAPGAKNTWVLTNAAPPSNTRDERPTPANVTEAKTMPLGNQTYRLIDVAHLNPAEHAGERVEVRGLLNSVTNDPRIDVLTFTAAGTRCGQ